MAPNVAPTIAPTVVLSASPSMKPTCVPSAVPTATPSVLPTAPPTVVPSVGISDCRVSCLVVSSATPLSIYPDTLVARVRLPPNFLITFDLRRVTLPDTPYTVNNVITIRDPQLTGTAGQFLKFGIMTQFVSTVEYGSGVFSTGPGLVVSYATVFTSFSVRYTQNKLIIGSATDGGNPVVYDVDPGNAMNTTGKVYDLYIAGPDAWYNVNVGLIKNLIISSKLFVSSAALPVM